MTSDLVLYRVVLAVAILASLLLLLVCILLGAMGFFGFYQEPTITSRILGIVIVLAGGGQFAVLGWFSMLDRSEATPGWLKLGMVLLGAALLLLGLYQATVDFGDVVWSGLPLMVAGAAMTALPILRGRAH